MALFSAIAAAMGVTLSASAAAGLAVAGTVATVAGAGAAIGSGMKYMSDVSGNKPNVPGLPKFSTAAEQISNAKDQAQNTINERRRAMARSQTVYTSPLGLGEEADMGRKTLLGQ